MLLKEEINKYLNYCKFQKELDDKTIKAYRADLEQFITVIGENNPDKEMLNAYLVYLHRMYKQKTVKRKIASVKALFHYLEEEELIRNYVPDQAFELTAVNHTENQGIHAARLTGLSKAQGEYILFLDQDDAISDSAVRTLLTAAEQTHADVVAGNGCRLFFTPEHILEKQIPIYAKKAVLKEVGHEKMYLYGTDMIFSPGQCLIRKAVIPRDWCKRRLTVNGCDDFLLWLLMFHEKRSFCAIEDKIYIHNDTVNSYSSSYEAMERSFYAVCEFLEQTDGYDKKKIQILRRRYALKSKLKQNGSKRQKINVVLMNLDILYYTLKYKIKGYY